jgi:hypothetical protein
MEMNVRLAGSRRLTLISMAAKNFDSFVKASGNCVFTASRPKAAFFRRALLGEGDAFYGRVNFGLCSDRAAL